MRLVRLKNVPFERVQKCLPPTALKDVWESLRGEFIHIQEWVPAHGVGVRYCNGPFVTVPFMGNGILCVHLLNLPENN